MPDGHTYLCRRKAAKARFDNRHSTSAPDPTLAPRQRQRRKRYKRSPEPTTSPAAPIPRDQHRQICTYPPRAKGSLNRRFEWFSLVTFFLQKKKVTRAGARNSPSRARRRRPPYPGGISRHQPKPPSGRLWRDLIIARPGEENAPTVAGASGRASLRAAGAAKLLLRTKTQTTLSPNKL